MENNETISNEVLGVSEEVDENKSTNDELNNEKSNKEDPPKAIKDPENPLDDVSEENIKYLVKQAKNMIQIMESAWNDTKEEFKLTDIHMKMLYQYNEEHREPTPENLTDEEKDSWDHFNGLDNITEEKVLEIFGEGHPIIGVDHTGQTVPRIKEVVGEFFGWMSSIKEYRQIHDAYMQLIEIQEEQEINKLRTIAENESNPETKQKMLNAIETYYNLKHLGFLAESLDEKDLGRLISAFSDSKKIEYWMNRSRDKLKQMGIANKIILEISQFEKRFLDEKYHRQSNILLLYFMYTITFCSASDKNDPNRNKALHMVFALDKVIRNTCEKKDRDQILSNIIKFEDQFLGKLPQQKNQ